MDSRLKMPKITNTHKKSNGSALPKDDNTCARLRLMGVLMALASVLMALLPMIYSGVYRYIAKYSGAYMSDFCITSIIILGFVVALLYFLLGLHVIRAGERNTRLVRAIYQMNVILTFLAVVAGVLLFMPWPVPTFRLVMIHMATANYIEQGIIPMFVMLFVDMSLIIGLVASVTSITYTCLIDKEKRR